MLQYIVFLSFCSCEQFIAVCCSVLQCVAVCCSVLQRVAVCCVSESLSFQVKHDHYFHGQPDSVYCHVSERESCSVLQCVAVCCSVLQCVAVFCSALQCVALCYSVLQFFYRLSDCVYCHVSGRESCSVLQCVAVCCSVLQRAAVLSWAT